LFRPVKHDALMAVLQEPPHHIRSHSAEADHSKLHVQISFSAHWSDPV
jgi:hypothetical protein